MVRAAPGRARVGEPVETIGGETLAPLADRQRVAAQLCCDLGVGAVSAAQASTIFDRNANACDDEWRRAPALERRAFLGTQVDLDGRPSATCHRFPPILADKIGERAPRTENSLSTAISLRISLPGQ